MSESGPANFTGEWIDNMHTRFKKTTSCFTEDDASFTPKPELYTVAAHIAHVADSIEWFIEPAFEGKPFNMDFEAMAAKAIGVKSLAAAFEWLDRAFESLKKHAGAVTPDQMDKALYATDSPIMPGATLPQILSVIEDHTAHHRGSLAVYARLLGKVPPMHYM